MQTEIGKTGGVDDVSLLLLLFLTQYLQECANG